MMLAKNYTDSKSHLLAKRIIITPKIDGYRCLVEVQDNGTVLLFSRQNNIINYQDKLKKQLSQLPAGLYDGELFSNDYNSTVYHINSHLDVDLFLFDMIFSAPCIERKNTLKWILDKAKLNNVHYVEPIYIGAYDENVVEESLKNYNGEGIMLNVADSLYQYGKRTKDVQKYKRWQFIEATVSKIISDKVVTIEYEYGSCNLTACGLSVRQKITVKYQELTSNNALRFPIFVKS